MVSSGIIHLPLTNGWRLFLLFSYIKIIFIPTFLKFTNSVDKIAAYLPAPAFEHLLLLTVGNSVLGGLPISNLLFNNNDKDNSFLMRSEENV